MTVAGRHPAVEAERRRWPATAWRSRTWATSPTSRSPGPRRRPPTAPGCASATSSSRIVGLRLVTGDGSVRRGHARAQRRRARRGPGGGRARSGILSTVTLQCVPAFNLHAVEQAERVDDVLERWDEEITGNDHFEFFWIPNTGWALTKRNRRTDEPARPRPRWRAFRDDYLLSNLAFDLTCRVGGSQPELGRRVAKAGARHRAGRVHRPQLPGVRQPPPGEVLRDGVRHAPRAPGRGAQPGAASWCGARACRSCSPSRCGWWRPTTSRSARPTAARRPTSPCTSTRAPPTTSTSRASRGSWTTTAAGPTGGRCTSRRRPPWRRATRAGTSSRPSARRTRPRRSLLESLPRPRPRSHRRLSQPSVPLPVRRRQHRHGAHHRRQNEESAERSVSDEGPGVAAAGVVDREAPLAEHGPGPGQQGVALERVEQGDQRRRAGRRRPGGSTSSSSGAGMGSPPNSQITVRSLNSWWKRQAVVDGPDVAVRRRAGSGRSCGRCCWPAGRTRTCACSWSCVARRPRRA